jgi:hypothetical protein
MVMGRPSHKEISRRIKEAKEAVSENRVSILSPANVAAAYSAETGRLFRSKAATCSD